MMKPAEHKKTKANADELVRETLCPCDLLRELRIKLLAFMLAMASPAFRRPIWKLLQHEVLFRSEQQVSRMERQMGIQ